MKNEMKINQPRQKKFQILFSSLQTQFNPMQPNSTKVNPSQLKSTQVNPSQPKSTHSIQLNSTQLSEEW